ncbi:hypothetical protein BLNAU_2467 [Blattamonas nauphoetae]|uniref:Uncharacterized protein n=1 Tax=Blattamonas nauphoetae TaxID=2049346 RepID=A0ABQ9YFY5_9EUKA|nr:hypothetical protein BLNAU_2467 [Blattamonas nauphoetae]
MSFQSMIHAPSSRLRTMSSYGQHSNRLNPYAGLSAFGITASTLSTNTRGTPEDKISNDGNGDVLGNVDLRAEPPPLKLFNPSAFVDSDGKQLCVALRSSPDVLLDLSTKELVWHLTFLRRNGPSDSSHTLKSTLMEALSFEDDLLIQGLFQAQEEYESDADIVQLDEDQQDITIPGNGCSEGLTGLFRAKVRVDGQTKRDKRMERRIWKTQSHLTEFWREQAV